MKKIFILLIILLLAFPVSARKVTETREQINALRDLFKGEEVDKAGNIWFVDSGQSHSGDGKTWDGAFITLDEAIGYCTASNGDVIYVAPGHAETLTSDGAVAVDVAGITIKATGNGDNRPVFTFTTSADADFNITADDCTINGLVFVNGINSQAAFITVTADDTTITKCEFRDGSSTSGLGAIAVGADDGDSDRLTVSNCKFYQPGTNNDHSIEILYDMVGIRIADNDIYGDFDEGGVAIPAGGNACTDLVFENNKIRNKQSSGYGIAINGTSASVSLVNNTVYTDDVDNAYYFDITILQGRGAGAGEVIDGTGVYPVSVADDSLWAKLLSKSALPSASSYSNVTDSQEMLSDKFGGFSGDGGAAQDDSVKASLDLAHTDLDAIIVDANTADSNTTLILADTAELQTDWTNGGRLDLLLDAAVLDANTADSNVTVILADTAELQTDWVNGGRLDLLLDAAVIDANTADSNVTVILADTAELQTDWVNGGRLDLLLDAAVTDANTADSNVTVILADTAELQTDWANGGRLDLLLDAAVIDANTADTNVTAILEDTGTTIPATITVIDGILDDANNALFGASGIASFPAAAQAGDTVSIAEVLRYVQENQLPRMETATVADMTGYDTLAWFTVTGDVKVRIVGVVGGTAITCTSGTTTLSIGTTEDADAIIAATTIDNADFDATDVWVDNNPEDDCEMMGVLDWVIVGGGADISVTRNVDDLTAGALTLYCWWIPLSSNGDVTNAF